LLKLNCGASFRQDRVRLEKGAHESQRQNGSFDCRLHAGNTIARGGTPDVELQLWNTSHHRCRQKVLGVLTERDLSTVGNLRGLSAGQIASTDVATCGLDDDIDEALETMDRRQIPGLPVLDNQGFLRGILHRHDILLQTDLKSRHTREVFWE
jgi:CBS domain-containing protein